MHGVCSVVSHMVDSSVLLVDAANAATNTAVKTRSYHCLGHGCRCGCH